MSSASLQTGVEEAQDPVDLSLERVLASVGKAGADESRPQHGVSQLDESTGGRSAVAGRNHDSPLALSKRLRDAADIGSDDGQPGRGRFEQNLRQPFRERHVQEGIGAPIVGAQLLAEGDVAGKLESGAQPKRIRLLLERLSQRTVSDHRQAPVAFCPKPAQDLGQEQRVLLGLEPGDGEQANGLSPVGIRLLLGDELGFANEGDAAHERLGAPVALGEPGADDDRRSAARQLSEGAV